MDKKEYIEKEILKLLHSWGTMAVVYGAAVIISLSLLDYLITPENFPKFFIYRVVTAFLFAIIFFLNRLKVSKYYQTSIFFLGTLVVTAMVELMILSFGGHQSSYYVGIILVFMFSLGFLPLFSITMTVLLALSTYSLYLFPILIFDHITDVRIFLNNNIFLIATASIGVAWRYYNDTLFIRKLSLEYDLSKDKERLKMYSEHLEEVVGERTKELKKSQAMLTTLYENANDGIVITDKAGIIINVNQSAAQIHGFEKQQMIGLNIEILELEKGRALWEERMNRLLNGEALIFETEHYKKDGSTVSLEVSSSAIKSEGELYIQSIHRDISEKKKLQAQLLHSQKMESIGTLAGGIAHDFNNILTSILGFTDLILGTENPTSEVTTKLRVIENSARKGTTLISKLLSFARKGSIEKVPFMINPVIEESLDMLSRIIPKDIVINRELAENIPPVNGDVNQVEQVMMNLIINAKDAMPEGGALTVKTSAVDLNPDSINISTDVRKGRYVKLVVSDTGIGIPHENLNRIFEPFFTTKETGKGTGLGLAMIYGIVKEHGGYITVRSKIEQGTTFNLYLPAAKVPTEKPRDGEDRRKTPVTEKILVIDDEIPVLQLIKHTLLKDGFDVTIFDNPLQGFDYFKANINDIDLVITDIVMPEMDGNQLIKNIRELKPSIKIIATTGFSESLGDIKIDGFLKKPFQSSKLLLVVKDVLNGGPKIY